MRIKEVGFTIIELLVVVSIIGILSAVLYANFGDAGAQSRDIERKADLRTMQSALELYKNKYGQYPAGCNGSASYSKVGAGWSGQAGTSHACPSGGEYIIGLAPEFIPVLPIDPKAVSGDSGYAYAVNAGGLVYKLMSRGGAESEIVTYGSEFRSCDGVNAGDFCGAVTSDGNNTPAHCQSNDSRFQSSYAVWGGFADNINAILVERNTENITCRW